MPNDEDPINNVSNQLAQLQKTIEALKKTETTDKPVLFVNRPYLQEQFDMNVKIKEKAERIIDAIDCAKQDAEKVGPEAPVDLEPEDLLKEVREIRDLVKNRNKDLRIAERAKDGFKAVERYRQTGKIGDDEEDEKAIQAAIKPPKDDDGRGLKRDGEASYGPALKRQRMNFVRFRFRPTFRATAPGYGAGFGYSGFQSPTQMSPIIIQPPPPGQFAQQHPSPPIPISTPRPISGPKPADQCNRCSAFGHWGNRGFPYPPGYNGVW